MKKAILLGCIMGISLLLNIFTANAADVCGITVPKACFVGGARVSSYPCAPEKDSTSGLSNMTLLGVDKLNERSQMRALQIELQKGCGGGSWGCIPVNETITNNDPSGSLLTADCSANGFVDGHYGICTAEALRRYINYEKVEKDACDKAPNMTITVIGPFTENKDIVINLNASGGTVYEWLGSSTNFTAVKGSPIEITGVTLIATPESGESKKETVPPFSTINPAKITMQFPQGRVVLSTSKGVITNSSIPANFANTATITVNPVNKTDLSCDQLLPKYLIGAKCDTKTNQDKALYGDARDITYWIQRFAGQITSFIAAVAVLIIAWNAFGLVASTGDSDKIAANKKAILWVGIGLLLTMFAYVIVKTIISLSF